MRWKSEGISRAVGSPPPHIPVILSAGLKPEAEESVSYHPSSRTVGDDGPYKNTPCRDQPPLRSEKAFSLRRRGTALAVDEVEK